MDSLLFRPVLSHQVGGGERKLKGAVLLAAKMPGCLLHLTGETLRMDGRIWLWGAGSFR
jgi:hypothetical protein